MSDENRQFREIEDQAESEASYNEMPSVLMQSIIDEAQSAIQADIEYHQDLDDAREFFDSKIFKKVNETGSQLMVPQLNKLTQGFRQPEGTPTAANEQNPEKLLVTEAVVRQRISEMRLNAEWKRHTKDTATDGKNVLGLSVDDSGLPFFKFIDPKQVHFESTAEGIHIADKTVAANWSFWFEKGEVSKLKAAYKDAYPEGYEQIHPGIPYAKEDNEEEGYQESEEEHDESEKKPLSTIMHVTCLSAPVGGTFGSGYSKIEIKKGEPFHLKIVGKNRAILCSHVGEEFPFIWQHTKEPFHPYVDFDYSYLRKGMRTISYVSQVRPYIEEIVYLRRVSKRNVKLVGEGTQYINVTGEGSESVKNQILANTRRDVAGKSKTHVKVVSHKDINIDTFDTAPKELNQSFIDNKINELKSELNEVIQVMTDGVSQQANEKVGVRRFREEAENGAVALWQENNYDNFKLIVRMILNTYLTITPKYQDEPVDIPTGIKDEEEGGEIFETISLGEAIQMLDVSVLKYDWNFTPILPTGGVAAAAQEETGILLERGMQFYPNNPEFKRAHLSHIAKQVQRISGTDAFSAERAMQADQEQMAAVQAMQSMSPEQMQSSQPELGAPELSE